MSPDNCSVIVFSKNHARYLTLVSCLNLYSITAEMSFWLLQPTKIQLTQTVTPQAQGCLIPVFNSMLSREPGAFSKYLLISCGSAEEIV